MSPLKHVLALALLTAAAALSSPLSAAQIGGPIGTPPPPGGGIWTARVKWYQPHWVNNVYYSYTYATITAATYGDCHLQLMAYTANPNVSVDQWCIQS